MTLTTTTTTIKSYITKILGFMYMSIRDILEIKIIDVQRRVIKLLVY
jgi:hypothetical protein